MKVFNPVDDPDLEFRFRAWHFSWNAQEIEDLKQRLDERIQQMAPDSQKLIRVYAFYKPSQNPFFVHRGHQVSPYLKVEALAPAWNEKPVEKGRFLADLETLDDCMSQWNLHPETLSRPIPGYVPRWRPGVKVSVRYGEYMGLSGEIVGDGERPETHQVKLNDGRVVFVDEDLMRITGKK